MAIDLQAIEARLKEALPGSVVDQDRGWLVLDPGRLVSVATYIRDELGFDWLSNITAADYPDRLEVVYNVYSSRADLQGPGLPFKVRLPDR
ncbi:MAG TPA: NADH-quinone oxidoreductase subunit C, partial [Anaerolineae bacterium]|nr:NADH-quinone oxidoreductase subunit C [Anaerolineae bacterium]